MAGIQSSDQELAPEALDSFEFNVDSLVKEFARPTPVKTSFLKRPIVPTKRELEASKRSKQHNEAISQVTISEDYIQVLSRCRFHLQNDGYLSNGLRIIRINIRICAEDRKEFRLPTRFTITMHTHATQSLDKRCRDNIKAAVLSTAAELKNPECLKLVQYLRSELFMRKFCPDVRPHFKITIYKNSVRICFCAKRGYPIKDTEFIFPLDCLKTRELNTECEHRIITGLYRYFTEAGSEGRLNFKDYEATRKALDDVVSDLRTSELELPLVRIKPRLSQIPTHGMIRKRKMPVLRESKSSYFSSTLAMELSEYSYASIIKRSRLTVIAVLPLNKRIAVLSGVMAVAIELALHEADVEAYGLGQKSFAIKNLLAPLNRNRIDDEYLEIMFDLLIRTACKASNKEGLSFREYLSSTDFQNTFRDESLAYVESPSRIASVFAPEMSSSSEAAASESAML